MLVVVESLCIFLLSTIVVVFKNKENPLKAVAIKFSTMLYA